MISSTSFFTTPPIPGNAQAPAAPPAAGTAAQPAPAPAPGASPAAYWASNGTSYATLPEIGQAAAAGRIPLGNDGTAKVQRIQLSDTASQQSAHKASAARFFKNSLITGVVGTLAGSLFPPLAMVGMVLSAWNGYKAFEEYQAAQQSPPTQYTVVEEGRIKGVPGAAQFFYEAIDNESYWNVVPSHPFGFKPGVPLDQVK